MFYDSWKSSISRKLLAFVILISSFFALLQTLLQIHSDYKEGLYVIDQRFEQIASSYIDSLARSVWEINDAQIDSIVSGISKLPDVTGISVEEIDHLNRPVVLKHFEHANTTDTIIREYPITRMVKGEDKIIGNLRVSITLTSLYNALLEKFAIMLSIQAVKTIVVSICLLYIFHQLVTRHLNRMASFSEEIDLHNLDQPLHLDRETPKRADELTSISDALNTARINMKQMLKKNEQIIVYQAELQQQEEKQKHAEEISAKNQELQNSNDELRSTIKELNQTQEQLIKSEQLAALGGMVAGVAHEMNTPIGVALTGSSSIREHADDMQLKLSEERIKKSELEDFLSSTSELSEVMENSLNKAATLIKSFKQISTEQHNERATLFNLHKNFNDIVIGLQIKLQKHNVTVVNELDKELVITGYPGLMYQIFTNFINNSLMHGFEGRESGQISMTASLDDKQVTLHYRDNGIGMDSDTCKKIFNPFFTTRRAKGGTGLGMHIVHNLVCEKLQGSLSVSSEPDQGTSIFLTLPLLTAAD